jgi:hypothetical protein
MYRIKYAALLVCICAAPLGCKDARNSDLTEPEVVPDDLAAAVRGD